MKTDWQHNKDLMDGGENYFLDGKGFYVSYNPHPWALNSLFGSDGGGDETALVRHGKFFILNGDHRSEYERLIPQGYKACREYFNTHKAECKSSWSD